MSNCNCEPKTYNIGMGCCQPVLAPIENYYTKWQIDRMIESATTSGCCITPEEVDDKISSAKTEIENEIPSLSGYATEQWVEDKHYITGVDLSDYALKSEIPTIPTNVSAFVNDAGYLTEHQSLDGYATEEYVNSQISSQTADFVSGEELSSYTYDKSTIDSKIASGGTFEPSQYYNKTETDNLLDNKLDVSAYTPTDLSDYYTKSETNNQISSATADMATKTWVGQQGYLTEHQSLSAYSTTNEVNAAINQATSGKANSSDVITNIKANPSNGKAAISYTKNGTNTSVDIFETFGRGLEYNKVTKQLSLNLVAGDGIQITNNNTISTTTKFQCLTEQEWASVSGNPDTNTVYLIH